MTDLTAIDRGKPPFRVLALDGGGIFGYFTALMLKKLCLKHPDFLRNSQITLFAGTSAGALISLLLARVENPREVVLSGELERFFSNGLLYSNNLEPMKGLLSLFGMTSWSGGADMMKLLDTYFGDLRMGDLKHRVLITSYNLAGKQTEPEQKRKWIPKIFYNFPNDETDRELLVKNVAYGAACPATIRPVYNGHSDGGVFTLAPIMTAIAKIVNDTEISRDHKGKLIGIIKELKNPSEHAIGFLRDVLTYWKVRRVLMWQPDKTKQLAPQLINENLFEPFFEKVETLTFANLNMADLKGRMSSLIRDCNLALTALGDDWREEVDFERVVQEMKKACIDEHMTYLDYIVASYENEVKDFSAFVTHPDMAAWLDQDQRKAVLAILSKGYAGRSFALRVGLAVISMVLLLFEVIGRVAEDAEIQLEKDPLAAIFENYLFKFVASFAAQNGGEIPWNEHKRDTHPSEVIKHYIETVDTEKAVAYIEREVAGLGAELRSLKETQEKLEQVIRLASIRFLDDIELFSMGVGSEKPAYFLADFDLGMLPFSMIPTNPWQKAWYPPLITLPMDSSIEIINYEAGKLLG